MIVVLLGLPAWSQVRVWEGTLKLPTYQEGQPDENPPFDVFATTKYSYPYTLRENLTDRRIDQTWRALYLENELLKCVVLPDIGGHLYTCTDKINGQSMFYANPSIKKAVIGYRGAWAAFGVEFNFPVSHNWVSMSPVDFAILQNSDGSASVWVGNIDRPYGMQWRVELKLRPGSNVLEQHVALYNRDDVRHRFYWWSNAGVQVLDDSHIYYPMQFTASHGFTQIDTWPVNSAGLDLSVVANHTQGPVSQFIHASREPFMGVYHPRTRSGLVHFSNWDDLPGKKIWSWGVDADGKDWRKALSDNESAYVEVQGGLFRNQETYAFLSPQETIEFREYWLPLRELGGLTRANLHGAVYLAREGGKLSVGLNVTHAIENATVRLKDGDKLLSEERVTLTPSRTYTKQIAAAPGGKATFEMLDASGRVLLAHTENTYDMDPPSEVHPGRQPVHRIPPAAERGAADFVDIATDEELNGKLIDAWNTYQQGLERFPADFELNKSAGRLAVGLLRYDAASRYLEAAAVKITNDPEIHYYLGLAWSALGKENKARARWDQALLFRSFRPAARVELSRLEARRGNLTAALDQINRALAESPEMIRAGAMEVALLRRAGQTEKANHRLAHWAALDPTSAQLRYERVRLGSAELSLWQHLAADPYRVLDLAIDYLEIGSYKDALDLLSRQYPAFDAATAEPGAVPPQQHPLVAYYRGYCREKLGESGAVDFAAASKLSTRHVFPNRAETVPVLRSALRANPSDATAHFLSGSMYLAGGMVDEALREWNEARRLNRAIPVLHRNLGLVLLQLKNAPDQALEVFREGLSNDRANLGLYSALSQTMTLLNRPASERVEALRQFPDPALMPPALVYDLALSLSEDGKAGEAEKLFENRFFARQEGGTNVRQIYLEVALLRALQLARAGRREEALAAAHNLGKERSGMAFTRDGLEPFLNDARTEFYLGEIESVAGSMETARQHWRKAGEFSGGTAWNAAFAERAAHRLDPNAAADWKTRLEATLARSGNGRANGSGLAACARGLMLADLGRKDEAAAALRSVFLLPDRGMSHHLARLALSEL
jgi:tetratricopeptide (TPR) repeat protein